LAEKPVARLPFFYGWIIVALGLLGMASWTGIRTAFAVFTPPSSMNSDGAGVAPQGFSQFLI